MMIDENMFSSNFRTLLLESWITEFVGVVLRYNAARTNIVNNA